MFVRDKMVLRSGRAMVLVFLFVSVVVSDSWAFKKSIRRGTHYHRKYKYTLDPEHAQELMSKIPLTDRLADEKWLDLIGPRKADKYTVKAGDNLWRLSGKFFKSPWLWNKFWQVNPGLSNPHEIEVGQVLSYYRPADRSPASIHIPLVKLLPSGSTRDLEDDSIVNLDIKNRFIPPLFVVEERELLGEVTGSYAETEALRLSDDFYVRMNDNSVPEVGQSFSVVRRLKPVQELSDDGLKPLGLLVELRGEVRVIGKGKELAQLEIVHLSGRIQRGDELIATQAPLALDSAVEPPINFEARVVMGGDPERKVFGSHHIVLLNKGTADGLQKGFFFRVIRDEDPQSKTTDGVDIGYKAEIQVVYAGKMSSIGYILRARDPVVVGDTMVAAQRFRVPFANPLPEPHSVELD